MNVGKLKWKEENRASFINEIERRCRENKITDWEGLRREIINAAADTEGWREDLQGRETECGKSEDDSSLDISFTKKGVEERIFGLADGKAPGKDGISGEFMKAVGLTNMGLCRNI
ncbi:hypothetical protein PV327_007348 [Microctonus hyperodae]|uniref:Uncharacterized protein n=1 Tax=Microctonus hyperodae TaxID=165561 RepID=A0AA39FYZ5_MICHY|nr:hypothetical protein PV327_007348 [Microctonus hyperodae]